MTSREECNLNPWCSALYSENHNYPTGKNLCLILYFPHRLNLEKNVEQFQYWADKFEMLPMYFMCFYGAQNINTVIEVIDSCTNYLSFAMQVVFAQIINFLRILRNPVGKEQSSSGEQALSTHSKIPPLPFIYLPWRFGTHESSVNLLFLYICCWSCSFLRI